jgi:hypothetical protein
LIANGKHRLRVKKHDGPPSQAIDVAPYLHVHAVLRLGFVGKESGDPLAVLT